MNVLIQQYLWEYIVAYCLNVLSISLYITSFNAIHQKKNKKHHHDKRHGSTTCFRRQPSSRILWVKCNFADTTIEETILPLQLRLLSSAAKVTDCWTARFWNWAKMCPWPDDQWPMISSKPVISTKYLQRIALDKITICVQQLCWFRPRLSHCAKEI